MHFKALSDSRNLINAAIIDRRYSSTNGDAAYSCCSKREDRKRRGEHGGAIKIKLRAPAVAGKANAALVDFLAKRLKVPVRRIVLLRGHKSRDKLVRIDGLSEEELRRRLL